jgi:hypothetical protein
MMSVPMTDTTRARLSNRFFSPVTMFGVKQWQYYIGKGTATGGAGGGMGGGITIGGGPI